jgi:hypothetical protein
MEYHKYDTCYVLNNKIAAPDYIMHRPKLQCLLIIKNFNHKVTTLHFKYSSLHKLYFLSLNVLFLRSRDIAVDRVIRLRAGLMCLLPNVQTAKPLPQTLSQWVSEG